MIQKEFAALHILLILSSVVGYVLGAPVAGDSSQVQGNSAAVPSHITKSDVLLLKAKLAELEADLDQLEPAVPAETTVDDDEDDELNNEAGDDADTEEDEQFDLPAEVVPDIPAPVQQVPPEPVPVENVQGPNPVVEVPYDQDDDDVDDDGGIDDIDDEVPEEDEEEGNDGEWMDGEAANEGIILPQFDYEENDILLRKLIIQALTVLYRKDADRIDRVLQEYENELLGDAVFEENFDPEAEDLTANNDEVDPQMMEAGAFAERPFTDQELHQEEVLFALASKRREDMNAAEQTLLSDMHTFEGEGITLNDLLKDLEDKNAINYDLEFQEQPQNEEIGEIDEEVEAAAFGQYIEDGDEIEDVGEDEDDAEVIDEDPVLDLQALQNTNTGGTNEDADDEDDEEEDADDVLMELMANLNSSLKKFEKNKAAQSPK